MLNNFYNHPRVNKRDGFTMFRPDEKKRAHLTESMLFNQLPLKYLLSNTAVLKKELFVSCSSNSFRSGT